MRPATHTLLLAVPFLVLAACSQGSDTSQSATDRAAAHSARAPMNPDPAANTYAPALGITLAQFTKQASGLYTHDDTTGTGPVATPGKTVQVHYTGWLADGDKFDSSLDRGEPIAFTLGQGEVIRGWDEGIAGMKVGGARTLVIPGALAYGVRGSPPDIPPNSVLVFRVKLVGVR